jgi:hypothetical protein
VFRLSVLALDKTSTPLRRTALCAPTSDLNDPCGLPPAPAQPAATPRVTLTRATLPAAPPPALRAPTRKDALVRCFRLSSTASHHLGWSWECVRGLGCTGPAIPPPTPTPAAYGNSMPSLRPSSQRLRRERLRRVSVSRPTFWSNAECAFPLHPSDSAPCQCFSALPACQTD